MTGPGLSGRRPTGHGKGSDTTDDPSGTNEKDGTDERDGQS